MGGTPMKRWLWLLLLIGIVCLWAGLPEELSEKLDQAGSTIQQNALFEQYFPQLPTLAERRELQSLWAKRDITAMQIFFDELALSHPHNPDYQYLRLRYLDASEQISGSRLIISEHPDFYWAYRLLAICLSEEILATKPLSLTAQTLETDIALLQKGFEKYPQDDDLAMALFLLNKHIRNDAAARGFLMQVQDPLALTANWQSIESFAFSTQDILLYSAKLPHLIGVYIQKGIIAREDSLAVFNDQVGNFKDQLSKEAQD
jgi:hypothetical protein